MELWQQLRLVQRLLQRHVQLLLFSPLLLVLLLLLLLKHPCLLWHLRILYHGRLV
jgi:hypothetical protein